MLDVLDPPIGAAVKIYVTHVYDKNIRLHDYYVHETAEGAMHATAADIVTRRFPQLDEKHYQKEVDHVINTVQIEPGVERRHLRCDSWFAHIDVMTLRP